jgi:hypothetical protein
VIPPSNNRPEQEALTNKPVKINSSFNSTDNDSPTSSISSLSDANQSTRLKKTTTYEVISAVSVDTAQPSTNRTVNTELLLGDTEQLIEKLKKSRQDKLQKSKRHSSASSSSTSENQTGRSALNSSWTIPAANQTNQDTDFRTGGAVSSLATDRAVVDDKNSVSS